jgi:hypothetical protein
MDPKAKTEGSRLWSSAPALLASAGLLWALVAALDPARPSGAAGGALLCAVALALQRRRGRALRPFVLTTVLSVALGIGAWVHPDFGRGDFWPYFAYLRSAAFDHDLDFANDFEGWGLDPKSLTATGHRRTAVPLGPALVWSPFFAAAHVYVVLDRAVGSHRYSADGNSTPYVRSALAGTVCIAVLGAWLLVGVLERRLPRPIALLAVLAAVGTSPILVYTFVDPGQSHGSAFGLACLGIWAAERIQRRPTSGAWAVAGIVTGLTFLMRLQAFVFGLVFLPIAIVGLARRTLRPWWLVLGFLAALGAASPQFLAWHAIYGSWFPPGGGGATRVATAPGQSVDLLTQPGRFFDFSAPYLSYVLFSTDRGLFAWSPGLLAAFVALVLGLRRWGLIGLGGLLVAFATAWFNGSYVLWWSGGDAFGGRRFDVVIPFLALGYGSLLAFLAARPLLAPSLLVVALGVWNAGLARMWRHGGLPDVAEARVVLGLQSDQAQQLSEDVLGRVAGQRGRALAYGFFDGRFFFSNSVHDGVVDLGSSDQEFLTGGWSKPINQAGPPAFRQVFLPRGCVRIPLLRPIEMAVRVTARTPKRLGVQPMTVTLNDNPVTRLVLSPEWTEQSAPLPASMMIPGQNLLCLEFEGALPGPPQQRVAAWVRRIVVH